MTICPGAGALCGSYKSEFFPFATYVQADDGKINGTAVWLNAPLACSPTASSNTTTIYNTYKNQTKAHACDDTIMTWMLFCLSISTFSLYVLSNPSPAIQNPNLGAAVEPNVALYAALGFQINTSDKASVYHHKPTHNTNQHQRAHQIQSNITLWKTINDQSNTSHHQHPEHATCNTT